MTAWARLLAASSLAIGTAWDLIMHPKTSGAGVVVNDGIEVAVASNSVVVEVSTDAYTAESAMGVTVEVPSAQIAVELMPSIHDTAVPTPVTLETQP